MAKCGITLNYPVNVVTVDDGGLAGPGLAIGTAQTLGQAVKLAERQGFRVREPDDGGQSRFCLGQPPTGHHFVVTVYPD